MRYTALALIIADIVIAGFKFTRLPSHLSDSYSVGGGDLYIRD